MPWRAEHPTLQHLEALSGFFGVPTTYLLDEVARQITEELALLSALRDTTVRSLALHLADLTPEGSRAS